GHLSPCGRVLHEGPSGALVAHERRLPQVHATHARREHPRPRPEAPLRHQRLHEDPRLPRPAEGVPRLPRLFESIPWLPALAHTMPADPAPSRYLATPTPTCGHCSCGHCATPSVRPDAAPATDHHMTRSQAAG